MENQEKYLPLGSVLMLKKGTHRVMVVGYCAQLAKSGRKELYDYIGCMFPEGLFPSENNFVFNHADISKIYHFGYVDDEVNKFQSKLKNVVKRMYDMEGK